MGGGDLWNWIKNKIAQPKLNKAGKTEGVVDFTMRKVHRSGRYFLTISPYILEYAQKCTKEKDLFSAMKRVILTGLSVHQMILDPDIKIEIKNVRTGAVSELLG